MQVFQMNGRDTDIAIHRNLDETQTQKVLSPHQEWQVHDNAAFRRKHGCLPKRDC